MKSNDPSPDHDRAGPKLTAPETACSVVMAAGAGLGTALNAADLGWWALVGAAIALGFAANLKRVLHPLLRLLAALAQLASAAAAGAAFVLSVPVLMMAESGAPLPFWVWPAALALLAACAVATVAGVRAFRRERSRTEHNQQR